MALLVLGLYAPKSVALAGRHQVPAHECQITVVASEEIAFVGLLTVVVCAGDLYVANPSALPDESRRPIGTRRMFSVTSVPPSRMGAAPDPSAPDPATPPSE